MSAAGPSGPLVLFCFFVFFYGLFLVDEGKEDPNTTKKQAIIDPPAKHYLNGVRLACR